jgi:hypothetical protein
LAGKQLLFHQNFLFSAQLKKIRTGSESKVASWEVEEILFLFADYNQVVTCTASATSFFFHHHAFADQILNITNGGFFGTVCHLPPFDDVILSFNAGERFG